MTIPPIAPSLERSASSAVNVTLPDPWPEAVACSQDADVEALHEQSFVVVTLKVSEPPAPPKPQVITLKIAKEAKVNNVNVSSSNPEFSTNVTSAGVNQFKIEVQPHNTSRDVNATLTITSDNGLGPVAAQARVISAASFQK